jgi:transcription initiation factor TFIIIB Brf1 subunit/transcription initiation factor TFIIB
MDNEDKSKFCNTKPENFITPYCSKLELNSEITKLCFFVSKRIEQLNLMHENTPQSIASGIIFFVSQLYKLPHITKSRVKEVCKISEVTVGKCCNKMEAVADQLVPREILENIQRTALLSNKSSSSKTSLTKTSLTKTSLTKTPLTKTSFPPLVATPNEV